MKKTLPILYTPIAWFAVAAQYYLMIENRAASIGETTIRFFSFFTILTNSMVAGYFTLLSLKATNGFFSFIKKPGILTALTSYITIVGLIYQLVLRQQLHPTRL